MASVALLSVEELMPARGGVGHPFIVVDARPRDAYQRGHIPSAVHVPWEAWCGPGPIDRHPITAQPGYWGLLAGDLATAHSRAWYAEGLARHGLAHDRPLAVYADGRTSKGREGRIAWMLLYLGAQRVFLIDGGWEAWRQAGGAVTRDATILSPGRFVVTPQEHRRAHLAALRRAYHAGTLPLLVDARNQAEFDGHAHPYLPRMGHLPTAVLVPFDGLYAPSGHYIGPDAYARLIPAALRSAPAVATYCEVGVRAATVALLHEIYTGQAVATYDGSLMEWALDPNLPVDRAYP